MYVGRDFPDTTPNEVRPVAFDFCQSLQVGETIASAIWQCSVAASSETPDGNAGGRISGSSTINGTIVTNEVSTMVAGVTYLLVCVITSSLGNEYELSSHITSVEAA